MQSINQGEASVYPWLFIGSIVRLLNPSTEWRKKAGPSRESRDSIGLIYCTTISASGFFIIVHIAALFHTSSSSERSQPQSFAMQRQSYLRLPVVRLSVPLSARHRVCMSSPRSTRPHPRGTAVTMVAMPITVTEQKAVSRGRAGGYHRRRWPFQDSAWQSLLSSLFRWQQSSSAESHASEICLHKEHAGLRSL